MKNKFEGLKNKLFDFWDSNIGYYEYSRLLSSNYNLGDHRFQLEILKLVKPDSYVLDLGCGTAEIGEHISKKAYYFGIDISSVALKMAYEYKFNNRFQLTRGNIENIPFKNESLDFVISIYSLEHFIEPKEVLLEASRVLKKKGRLILLSVAYDNPFGAPPPSLGITIGNNDKHWDVFSKKIFPLYLYKRIKWIVRQFIKCLKLAVKKNYYKFELINKPLVLSEGYKHDNDTVYIVSAKEVENFLRAIGMKIVFRYGRDNILFNPNKDLFIIAEKGCHSS